MVKDSIAKTTYTIFHQRLVIKCMGKKEWIEKFCSYIARAFTPERITFSPIYNNRGRADYECFCFINLLMDATNNTKDIVRKLEPPEEPPLDKEV